MVLGYEQRAVERGEERDGKPYQRTKKNYEIKEEGVRERGGKKL